MSGSTGPQAGWVTDVPDTKGTATRRITIFDTTLRDGEQAPGNAMRPDQKAALAAHLEQLGVDRVESGFPASSPSDFEATRLISQQLRTAQLATFSRLVRRDVELAVEAGGVTNHQVQLVATASDLHLEHKRGITRRQAVDELVDTVRFARSLGIQDVSVGLEDASRGDDDLIRCLTESAVEAGSNCVIVADTTGCCVPAEFGDLITKVRDWAPGVRTSVHCHNDLGFGLSNALAGLAAGADEVQVTLGGIGERSGNTALEQVAAVLAYKSHHYGFHADLRLDNLHPCYELLRDVIGLAEPRTMPILGQYAFGTAAGIHQQGMLNNPATYEYIEPSRFGRKRSLLIARHSGRAILRHMLERIGVQPDDAQIEDLYRRHISDRAGDCEDLEVVQQRLAEDVRASRIPV